MERLTQQVAIIKDDCTDIIWDGNQNIEIKGMKLYGHRDEANFICLYKGGDTVFTSYVSIINCKSINDVEVETKEVIKEVEVEKIVEIKSDQKVMSIRDLIGQDIESINLRGL